MWLVAPAAAAPSAWRGRCPRRWRPHPTPAWTPAWPRRRGGSGTRCRGTPDSRRRGGGGVGRVVRRGWDRTRGLPLPVHAVIAPCHMHVSLRRTCTYRTVVHALIAPSYMHSSPAGVAARGAPAALQGRAYPPPRSTPPGCHLHVRVPVAHLLESELAGGPGGGLEAVRRYARLHVHHLGQRAKGDPAAEAEVCARRRCPLGEGGGWGCCRSGGRTRWLGPPRN